MKLREVRMSPVVALIAFSCLLAAGCAKEEGGAIVKGKVAYKGKPVERGTISFIALGGASASSKIAPDGSYALLNVRKTDRIPVGSYDVVIMAGEDQLDMGGGNELMSKMKIPVPLSVIRLATTPLHYEVVEGPNTIDINLDELPSESPAGGK